MEFNEQAMKTDNHTLHIVGTGPGGEGFLTAEARELIASCRVAAGGRRSLELAPAGAETFEIGADLEAARDFIAGRLTEGDVCVLVSGDPGCYSLLGYITSHFRADIRVAPGISAVQAMAAQLRQPWHDWRLVSLHGRGYDLAPLPDPGAPTLYFCDTEWTPPAIAADLPQMLASRQVAVGASLGQDDQQVWQGSLSEAAGMDFPGSSLLLVFPQPREAEESTATGTSTAVAPIAASAPGIPDELWLRRQGIPLSKSEVRSVLLAKAQPRGRRVIWDSGAGTGSYGIECALLEPRARVYAIDKNEEACQLIVENAARFGAVVTAVHDEAPSGFGALPRPDLVIVGGNDGRLEEIFGGALAALAPGGRLVVTALLEETKKRAHSLLAASGLENRAATRVAVSRGEERKWVEHNPVIIFTGDKATNA